MKRVTGIGGIFFKSKDAAAKRDWYRTHLGIESSEYGFPFQWRQKDDPDELGYSVWAPFAADTTYFGDDGQAFMVNYRVDDLVGLLAALKAEGVEQVGDMMSEANGKFAWILDPEGHKIELWEPVPNKDDPYL